MITLERLKTGYYALVFFSILVTGLCESNVTYGAGGAVPMNSYERQLLDRINRYRTGNGLNPLTPDATLQTLARDHCRYMQRKNSLSHSGFQERFEKCGRSHCVENVGWNSPTPEAQIEGWKTSRGHNANLLNRKIKYAGIAKSGPYVAFFACD